MRLASEARRSLTKFVSTIVIAVFIEALVMVFREGGEDITMVLYPSVILFMGILTILGLSQRLSVDVEAAEALLETHPPSDKLDGGPTGTNIGLGMVLLRRAWAGRIRQNA